MDTVPRILEDLSLSARPWNAGMERHGRLLCRAPEAQQIAMSRASGPLRLLIPQGGGPTMLKCLRGGPEAPDFAGRDDSAWRLTLLPASAGCAPRLRAGRERFGA